MPDFRSAFIKAATWHGGLHEAEAMLAAHPELTAGDIHIVAILGDDEAVRRLLGEDRNRATAKSAPYGGDALNYLGLSKYLRLDPKRTPGFLRAATALLDAGADPNTAASLKADRGEPQPQGASRTPRVRLSPMNAA